MRKFKKNSDFQSLEMSGEKEQILTNGMIVKIKKKYKIKPTCHEYVSKFKLEVCEVMIVNRKKE